MRYTDCFANKGKSWDWMAGIDKDDGAEIDAFNYFHYSALLWCFVLCVWKHQFHLAIDNKALSWQRRVATTCSQCSFVVVFGTFRSNGVHCEMGACILIDMRCKDRSRQISFEQDVEYEKEDMRRCQMSYNHNKYSMTESIVCVFMFTFYSSRIVRNKLQPKNRVEETQTAAHVAFRFCSKTFAVLLVGPHTDSNPYRVYRVDGPTAKIRATLFTIEWHA